MVIPNAFAAEVRSKRAQCLGRTCRISFPAAPCHQAATCADAWPLGPLYMEAGLRSRFARGNSAASCAIETSSEVCVKFTQAGTESPTEGRARSLCLHLANCAGLLHYGGCKLTLDALFLRIYKRAFATPNMYRKHGQT